MQLFTSRGFAAVTMEQVAEAADIAKGTLYNHFPQKEALAAFWVESQLARDLDAVGEELRGLAPEAALQRLLDRSSAWCEAHRWLIEHYLRYRLSRFEADDRASRDSDLEIAFSDIIAEGQQSGAFRRERPADQLASFLQHLHLAALLRWLTIPGSTLQEEVAAALDLFLRGCGQSSGQA